jgi:hypothetical protein
MSRYTTRDNVTQDDLLKHMLTLCDKPLCALSETVRNTSPSDYEKFFLRSLQANGAVADYGVEGKTCLSKPFIAFIEELLSKYSWFNRVYKAFGKVPIVYHYDGGTGDGIYTLNVHLDNGADELEVVPLIYPNISMEDCFLIKSQVMKAGE